MSSSHDLKEGDLVICVNPGWVEDYNPMEQLSRGKAYRITEVDGLYCSVGEEPDMRGFYYKRFIKVDDICLGTLDHEGD